MLIEVLLVHGKEEIKMFGQVFKCCKCDHSFEAGGTRTLETHVLPGATFYSTGDSQGLWVSYEGNRYCGKCSDVAFPQITQPGVELKSVGRRFF